MQTVVQSGVRMKATVTAPPAPAALQTPSLLDLFEWRRWFR